MVNSFIDQQQGVRFGLCEGDRCALARIEVKHARVIDEGNTDINPVRKV
jgi:hypothetical protein